MSDPICASTFVDCGTPGRTSVPAPKVAGRWPDRTLLRSAPADGRRRCERTSELAHGRRRRSDSSFRTTTDKSGPQATPLALCTSGAQVCDGTVEASASASSCVNCRMDVKSQALLCGRLLGDRPPVRTPQFFFFTFRCLSPVCPVDAILPHLPCLPSSKPPISFFTCSFFHVLLPFSPTSLCWSGSICHFVLLYYPALHVPCDFRILDTRRPCFLCHDSLLSLL